MKHRRHVLLVCLAGLSFGCRSTSTPPADGRAGSDGADSVDTGSDGGVEAGSGGSGGSDALPPVDGTADAPDAAPAPDLRPPADLPTSDGGTCDEDLTASSNLVASTCAGNLSSGPAVTIPDGTYDLVAIRKEGGCFPSTMPPPASAVIRVTGPTLSAVEGAMGDGGVVFTRWKARIIYNTTMVLFDFSCGSTEHLGDEMNLDPTAGTLTFFRKLSPSLEAWVFKKE